MACVRARRALVCSPLPCVLASPARNGSLAPRLLSKTAPATHNWWPTARGAEAATNGRRGDRRATRDQSTLGPN